MNSLLAYNRYAHASQLAAKLCLLPTAVQSVFSRDLRMAPKAMRNSLSKCLPKLVRPENVGNRAYKLSAFLETDNNGLYRSLLSHSDNPDEVVIRGNEWLGILWNPQLKKQIPNFITRMQYLDTCT